MYKRYNRGIQYNCEIHTIKHTSNKNLPAYIEDVKRRYKEANSQSELGRDLLAAWKYASIRLAKNEAKKKKAEALREKTALIAEYLGKTRKVAKTVRNRLQKNTVCPYCGNYIGEEPHADHIYPVSKGGKSKLSNMVYICGSCNLKKRDLTLSEFIVKFNLNRDMVEQNLEFLRKSF